LIDRRESLIPFAVSLPVLSHLVWENMGMTVDDHDLPFFTAHSMKEMEYWKNACLPVGWE
jgi:hypothetical protein